MKINNGFTILEVIITMALFSFVASLGLTVGIDAYSAYNSDSEKSLIIDLLQKARSQAFNNINETYHGVHLGIGDYVLFEGQSYSERIKSRDLTFPHNAGVKISGVNDIIFSPLKGSTAEAYILLNDSRSSSTIFLSSQGNVDLR